ncbi:MAG: type II toxin-antitoxin system RelE/ParE family toxin [Gammaproteobacteria bacterium]|nr:type II toxin-antitoxin system RelE/ParE family toxin [Gammaproteobacteria bacterium]
MSYAVNFLPEVYEDLKALGNAKANRVLKVIEERIQNGEPEKTGNPLRSDLKGYRRIRTGDTRIVYKVIEDKIEVLVIAVGPRRNDEIYKVARKRI